MLESGGLGFGIGLGRGDRRFIIIDWRGFLRVGFRFRGFRSEIVEVRDVELVLYVVVFGYGFEFLDVFVF